MISLGPTNGEENVDEAWNERLHNGSWPSKDTYWSCHFQKKNVVHIGVVNWAVGPISIGSLKSGLHLAKTKPI